MAIPKLSDWIIVVVGKNSAGVLTICLECEFMLAGLPAMTFVLLQMTLLQYRGFVSSLGATFLNCLLAVWLSLCN